MSFQSQIRTQHYINGQWCDSIEPKTFDVFNPATEEKITSVQQAGPKDVDKAVEVGGILTDGGREL